MVNYGTTSKEAIENSKLKCHKIVKTVVQFGVTDKEKLKIIYLLALELENNDAMRSITDLITSIEENEEKASLITEL